MSVFRPSESTFFGAAESLPLAVVIGDREGRVTYLNPAADALFGLRGRDARGLDLTLWVAPSDRERCHDLRRKLLVGDPVEDALILELQSENGSRFPAELTLSALIDDDGEVIGTVSLARDVTERVATQADAARLRGIVDAAAEAILGVDVHGTVLFFSPSAERLFGWPAPAIVGQSGDLLVTPEYRIGAPALLAELEAKGRCGRTRWRCAATAARSRSS